MVDVIVYRRLLCHERRFDIGNTRVYYQASTNTLFWAFKDLGAAPQDDPNLVGFRIVMTLE